MKAVGIVRKMDRLGRIVLPKELRDSLNIPEGSPLEFSTNDNEIIIKRSTYTERCIVCKEKDTKLLYSYKNVVLCKKCLNKFSKEK